MVFILFYLCLDFHELPDDAMHIATLGYKGQFFLTASEIRLTRNHDSNLPIIWVSLDVLQHLRHPKSQVFVFLNQSGTHGRIGALRVLIINIAI